jgi:undecaprenyl-diphosphatase
MKARNYLLFGIISFIAFLLTSVFVFFCISQGFDAFVNQSFFGKAGFFLEFVFYFNYITNNFVFLGFSAFFLFILLFFKKFKQSSFFIFMMGGTYISKEIVKNFFQRARPENALIERAGFSFPSGHTLIAFVFVLLIIYFFKKEIKMRGINYLVALFGTFFIVFIGVSRLYLRLHWFTDILGSVFLGVFIFAIGIFIFENYFGGLSKSLKRLFSKG